MLCLKLFSQEHKNLEFLWDFPFLSPPAFPRAALLSSALMLHSVNLRPSLLLFIFLSSIFQPCNQLEFCFKGDKDRNTSWFLCCQVISEAVFCWMPAWCWIPVAFEGAQHPIKLSCIIGGVFLRIGSLRGLKNERQGASPSMCPPNPLHWVEPPQFNLDFLC